MPCGGGENAAPYLHKYFETILDFTKDLSDPENVKSLLTNRKAREEVETKKKKLKGKLFGLIVQAFNNHDTDGDGILDLEESKVFFGHFVDEQQKMVQAMCAMAGGLMQAQIVAQLDDPQIPPEMKQMMKGMLDGAAEALKAQLRQTEEQNKKLCEAYRRNKAERDSAAFKVIDADGSGTLQMNEVVAALTPETASNTKLMKALGFDSADCKGQSECKMQ